MSVFRFAFDIEIARQLRDVINEKQDISINKEDILPKSSKTYLAWDRICAIMDRVYDTIQYINLMELGVKENRAAFDFYEFISCSAVIIDSIRCIGSIFNVDPELVKQIEETQQVFGSKYGEAGTDRKFFEYIRSLCVTHPLYTNRHSEYLNGAKFHCCPFVTWSHFFSSLRQGDLNATVYTSQRGEYPTYIPLYINEFEAYLKKWIDHLSNVIDAIHQYNDDIYEQFRHEPVKNIDDFDKPVEYLHYLKAEYARRFGDTDSYIFDEYIRIFQINLTDAHNQLLLEKYRCAILYALTFLRSSMQNMKQEGVENTGIQYEEPGLETDIFIALSHFYDRHSDFAQFSYNLEKACYLEPESQYGYYDKLYARSLLEGVKETINRYVLFDNTESDDETLVIIALARYLEALTKKTLLNRNIPNEEAYRVQVLSEEEWEKLFQKDLPAETADTPKMDLEELLKLYGQ